MSRTYSFTLPVTVSAFYTSMAQSYLTGKGIWSDLPVSFQWLVYNAAQAGTGVTITKAELDQISDEHWAHIEPFLKSMV